MILNGVTYPGNLAADHVVERRLECFLMAAARDTNLMLMLLEEPTEAMARFADFYQLPESVTASIASRKKWESLAQLTVELRQVHVRQADLS